MMSKDEGRLEVIVYSHCGLKRKRKEGRRDTIYILGEDVPGSQVAILTFRVIEKYNIIWLGHDSMFRCSRTGM